MSCQRYDVKEELRKQTLLDHAESLLVRVQTLVKRRYARGRALGYVQISDRARRPIAHAHILDGANVNGDEQSNWVGQDAIAQRHERIEEPRTSSALVQLVGNHIGNDSAQNVIQRQVAPLGLGLANTVASKPVGPTAGLRSAERTLQLLDVTYRERLARRELLPFDFSRHPSGGITLSPKCQQEDDRRDPSLVDAAVGLE